MLFWAVLIAPVLFVPELSGSSEAREVHVVDVMRRTGELLLPLRDGLVPSKPLLTHWLALPMAVVFGNTVPGMVRLVSLLAAISMAFAALTMARRFSEAHSGNEGDGSNITTKASAALIPWLCLGVLFTSYHFVRMAIDARVDMVFASFVTWSIYGGFGVLGFGALEGVPRRRFLYPASAAAAAAVLAKGPLGVALPALVVGLFSCRVWGLRKTILTFFRPHLSWLFLLIPVCWYVAAFFRGGDSFLDRQLFFENLERVVGSPEMNKEAWWFYLPSFVRGFFPWSLIFLGIVAQSLLVWWRQQSASSPRLDASRASEVGMLWAICGVIVFFSLVSGKRHSYLLPLVPLIAVFISVFGRSWLHLTRIPIWIFGVPLAVLPLVIEGAKWFDFSDFNSVTSFLSSWGGFLQIGAILVASAVFLFARRLRHRSFTSVEEDRTKSFACAALALSVAVAWYTSIGFGVKAVLKPHLSIAKIITEEVPQHAELIAVRERKDEYLDATLFYLRREVALQPIQEARSSCLSASASRRFFILDGETLMDSGFRDVSGVQIVGQALDLDGRGDNAQAKGIFLLSCSGDSV